MSSALAGVEPQEIWKHFEALAAIPRASTKEAAARAHVLSLASKLGLEAVVDQAGNVVVRKPAFPGRESAPVTALQGHLDMVCEKNEGTEFNFDTDGIRMVRKDDWLYADGTTLGSDNGVGVAAALAVMESKTIKHGPMEFVFTVEEETTLGGATAFKPGVLKAHYLLNLDNEEKGTLCIGCAGGLNTRARRKVAFQAPEGNAAYRVKVSGLKGGHSGVDIHLGRGNAVRILGGTLQLLMEQLPVELADIKGGSAHNAIPREASAILVTGSSSEGRLKSIVTQFAEDVRTDLGSFDPDLQITVEKAERPQQVIAEVDAKKVVDLIASLHHGVLAMSPDVPGLVQDSTNVATVSLKDGVVEIVTSQRSAIEGSKNIAKRLVATSCLLAGFEVEHSSSYPGWKPEPNSDIVRKSKEVYEAMYGATPNLIAMHAGLETGVLGVNYPDMQMISFGPQIEHPHSPAERVQISSVSEFWKYLTAVLEKL
ncbi:MAG TPA: aminoacyl-histidine dipeptidase [Candidatus Saccharimonadales bacterium]|nr:aminoacyl-histidine dipeptidase [Candidatus Saccharimonadales bacterium]